MVALRDRIGEAVFARVAGPDGPAARERIHGTPGPRWFAPDSAIARVHGDASMFVGGMRAVILQTLHPAAMRAFSGFWLLSCKSGKAWIVPNRLLGFLPSNKV